jgi:hypothetical protein
METAKKEEEWVSTDKVALVDFLAKPGQGVKERRDEMGWDSEWYFHMKRN